MNSLKGVCLLLVFVLHSTLFASSSPYSEWKKPAARQTYNTLKFKELFSNDQALKTNMFSKVEVAHNHRATPLLKVFDLGELTVSSPYLPFSKNQKGRSSQASLDLDIPDEWGGFQVHGGISFQVEDASQKRAQSQERLIYVVSTKNLADNKWKPFLTFSYMRSEIQRLFKARPFVSAPIGADSIGQARYLNMEALGTCCGLQPLGNLSVVLSYNYLKPLRKGVRLSHQNTKVFDDLKSRSHAQNVDFKIDYAIRDGLNFLVKSEYIVPNGTLRDTVDMPVLIEGHLIVSF